MANDKCKHGLEHSFCAFCNPSKDIQFSLTEFARRYSDLNSSELVKKALESMTTSQQHKLLASLLKGQFDTIRRSEVRSIEQASILSEIVEEKKKRPSKTMYDDTITEAPWRWNIESRPRQQWENLKPQMRRYTLMIKEPEYAKFLEAKGITDYLSYNYHSYGIERDFAKFEDSVRKEVTFELTAELLGSSFSTPDGRSVTWGEATVMDHRSRITFLLSQASGTVGTAKLHRAAVQLLTSHQRKKLNEIAAAEVVAA